MDNACTWQKTNETICSCNYKHFKLLSNSDIYSRETQQSTGWLFYWIVFAGYRIPDTFQKFQIATTGYWILASTGWTEQDTKSLLSFIKQLSVYTFFIQVWSQDYSPKTTKTNGKPHKIESKAKTLALNTRPRSRLTIKFSSSPLFLRYYSMTVWHQQIAKNCQEKYCCSIMSLYS